jgi:SAM-dependent methyltransferase
MDYQNYFARKEVIDEYTNSIETVGLWNAEKQPLLNNVYKDAAILDIGTGAGRVAFGLYKLGYNNIIATDFCNEILHRAIEYNTKISANIKFLWDDITDSKLGSSKFDAVIFSFNGLILIPDDNKRKLALWHINRVLKDNGLFIFSTDNRRTDNQYKWFWNQEIKRWKQNEQDQRINHYGEVIYHTDKGDCYFHHYRPEELIELLNHHGFVIIEDFDVGKKYLEEEKVLQFAGNSHMWVCRKY